MTPDSEDALCDVVRAAAAAATPLRIVGGGTRSGIGRPVAAATPVSTAGLSGVTLYEPGAMTLIAKAGTPLAEIEALLATERQYLAFEPMDHRPLLGSNGTPTVGGVVSANVSGPRRLRAGACRDFLLGLRFVDGHGRLVKNGGRVMKNVTGLDLGKLLCGAYGTLGIVTEVALKTLPRPERAATLVFDGLTDAQAVALFCKALGTPFEVSGAAFVDGRALLRIEGLTDQVGYRIDRLTQLLERPDRTVIKGADHTRLWDDVRDVRTFADSTGSVWRLSVKATDAPAITSALQQSLGAQTVLDWGGGLIWARLPQDAPAAAGAHIRQILAPLGGHATLIRAGADLRAETDVFQPEPAPLAGLSAGLRARFDPQNILNPGLMAV
ncbi:glycolate oxidase subunit GlcE [Pseudoruegeria sp. SK021]|nr:glycolate oxidase subunit GlcE [Pseudoruegeria sp. SK021]